MSKKKRSKKRERIPVIDTLIDLAGAMTLVTFLVYTQFIISSMQKTHPGIPLISSFYP